MALLRLSSTLRPLRLTSTSIRNFSLSIRHMAEGDAGAPRSGGSSQGDAFTKREQANEDYYVKRQEQEKLAALKAKIADQEAELAKHRKEVEDLQKKS